MSAAIIVLNQDCSRRRSARCWLPELDIGLNLCALQRPPGSGASQSFLDSVDPGADEMAVGGSKATVSCRKIEEISIGYEFKCEIAACS